MENLITKRRRTSRRRRTTTTFVALGDPFPGLKRAIDGESGVDENDELTRAK